MSSMEFGVKHYAGQVWYNVEGFLDKNRDTLRYDVMALLISSKDKLISKMFLDLHNLNETTRTMHKANGQFITMKPRTPTVAARFQVYVIFINNFFFFSNFKLAHILFSHLGVS